ncbi:MAG: hypothetical protein AB8G14_01075 [Ilumatobacter sp.]
MNTQNVQHMLVDTICGLFRDPQNAHAYATNPQAYLDDKMGDYDMTGVDMPAAVHDAAVEAKVSPEMTEQLNQAIYQPAAAIRVPVPREYQDDTYEGGKDYPVKDVGVDEGVRSFVDEQGKPVEDPQRDGGMDNGGMQDRDRNDMDRDRNDRDHDRNDMDRNDMNDGRPPIVEDHRELPPIKDEIPEGYEMMDGGGYRMEAPENYAPENYHPDNYQPDTEMDLGCVEYSVSNCVTTMYHDKPEIADKLCETRDYDDKYNRMDESHGFADAPIEQHPEYADAYEYGPGPGLDYDNDELDRVNKDYDPKDPENKYDDGHVDEHGNQAAPHSGDDSDYPNYVPGTSDDRADYEEPREDMHRNGRDEMNEGDRRPITEEERYDKPDNGEQGDGYMPDDKYMDDRHEKPDDYNENPEYVQHPDDEMNDKPDYDRRDVEAERRDADYDNGEPRADDYGQERPVQDDHRGDPYEMDDKDNGYDGEAPKPADYDNNHDGEAPKPADYDNNYDGGDMAVDPGYTQPAPVADEYGNGHDPAPMNNGGGMHDEQAAPMADDYGNGHPEAEVQEVHHQVQEMAPEPMVVEEAPVYVEPEYVEEAPVHHPEPEVAYVDEAPMSEPEPMDDDMMSE